MKKLFKALVALALCSIMLVGSVAGGLADLLDGFSVKASASANYLGDYIYYGTYPQSEVKDEALVDALNGVEGNWISYRYFSGSGKTGDGQMKPADYMYYKDIVYDGNKYRAVTFDKYRPYSSGLNHGTEYTYQINNGYEINTVYWFKFEPIKWHVLDESSGLIMADIILDAQPYNNYCFRDYSIDDQTYSYFGNEEQTYFANDYSSSDIRQWLNNDFYITAFSEENKENIISTELNNDCFDTLTENSGYERLNSSATNDNIFLLSYTDVVNKDYGFVENMQSIDSQRLFKGSDYAKAQGLYVFNNPEKNYNGFSPWYLRTPGIRSDVTCSVDYSARVSYITGAVGISGIVPALRLRQLKSDINDIITISYNNDGTHTIRNADREIIAVEKCEFDVELIPSTSCTTGDVEKHVCAKCGNSYSVYYTSPGHEKASPVIENEVSATCTTDGGYDSVVYCKKCHEEVSREFIVTEHAEGHKNAQPVCENEVSATCISRGSCDSVVYCEVCHTEISREHISEPAKGHTLMKPVKENETSANCTADGGYDMVTYCEACGMEVMRAHYITGDAKGHTDSDKNGYCDVCGSIVDFYNGNPCRDAVINVASPRKVDYKTNVTVKATATGVPDGYYLVLYTDNAIYKGTNTEVIAQMGNIKSDVTYTVKVVNKAELVQKDGAGNDLVKDGGRITCNNGFFVKLIALFRGLFGLIPSLTIEP
ncbi:MAG: DUF6273 domain-containing protein [Acutalibacteraceae bacterium]